jgi:transcriptional regulator with XRE-family HTH domain
MAQHEASFGERLRQMRVRAGLSQAAVAERANLSPAAVATRMQALASLRLPPRHA